MIQECLIYYSCNPSLPQICVTNSFVRFDTLTSISVKSKFHWSSLPVQPYLPRETCFTQITEQDMTYFNSVSDSRKFQAQMHLIFLRRNIWHDDETIKNSSDELLLEWMQSAMTKAELASGSEDMSQLLGQHTVVKY